MKKNDYPAPNQKNTHYQVLPVVTHLGVLSVTFSRVIFVTSIWGIKLGHLEEAGSLISTAGKGGGWVFHRHGI